MAKKATFDAWVEDTQKRLKSDEQKKALEVLLADEAVKDSVFGGHLREQDYYKRMNEFNVSKQELYDESQKFASTQKEWREWREQAQEQLDEALREKAELERRIQYGDVTEEGTNPTASKVTPQMRAEMEELRKEVELANSRTEALDTGSTRLIIDMANIMRKSFKSGIDVDPAAIVQYQIDNKCDPMTAFDALTHDERMSNWQKEQEKRLQDAREEGRKEERQKSGHAPDYIPKGGPSTVEFFTTNASLSDNRERAKAATDLFYKLAAAEPR